MSQAQGHPSSGTSHNRAHQVALGPEVRVEPGVRRQEITLGPGAEEVPARPAGHAGTQADEDPVEGDRARIDGLRRAAGGAVGADELPPLHQCRGGGPHRGELASRRPDGGGLPVDQRGDAIAVHEDVVEADVAPEEAESIRGSHVGHVVEQPLPRQGHGRDGRSAELADAPGHPLHGPRDALRCHRGDDLDGGLAEGVERQGMETAQGRGQLLTEGPPVLGRGGEVGEVLTGFAAAGPLHHEQRAVAQPVLHLVGKERAWHRYTPVVVDGPQDRELVCRLRREQADRPVLAHDHAGREVRGVRERDQDGLLGAPARDGLHRRHRELGRGGELVAEVGGELLGRDGALDRRSRGIGLHPLGHRDPAQFVHPIEEASLDVHHVATEPAGHRIGAPGGRGHQVRRPAAQLTELLGRDGQVLRRAGRSFRRAAR